MALSGIPLARPIPLSVSPAAMVHPGAIWPLYVVDFDLGTMGVSCDPARPHRHRRRRRVVDVGWRRARACTLYGPFFDLRSMGAKRESTPGDRLLTVEGLRDGLREGLHWVEAWAPVLPSNGAGLRRAACLTTPPQRRVVMVKQSLQIALMVQGRTGASAGEEWIGRPQVNEGEDQWIWWMG